jgi:hypothetical protein
MVVGGNYLQEVEEADKVGYCYVANHVVCSSAFNNGREFQINVVYIKVINIFVTCKNFTRLR